MFADQLAARFGAVFGGTPRVYRAPGRVNLIGEHTDYNEGFVLPAALELSAWVAATPRDDGRLVVQSDTKGKRREWDLDPEPRPGGGWGDYVLGVSVMLRREGHADGSATLLVASDVPLGAGLSSSAALEVAVATALLDVAGARLDPTATARLCQRVETEFVGARVGIMDQFVACHASPRSALLLDCRSLESRPVPVPSGLRLVACNTLVRHRHATGEYNRRRAECERGVAIVRARHPDVASLRDVDPSVLEAYRAELPDEIFRRCRHVVTENLRVMRMAAALEQNDLAAIGPLMAASHKSLRDDYEVSSPELDAMVEAAAMPGVYGSRMTGGGFGGCTVNLVVAEAVDEFVRQVPRKYEASTGRRSEIYVSDAGGGAARVR